MLKRGTVGAALLTMALSAAAFFGTLWAAPLIPESFMVHKPNWVYLPPVIQIPIFVVVGASVIGEVWGLLRLILILMAWLRRRRRPIAAAPTDEDGVWPPAPTAPWSR